MTEEDVILSNILPPGVSVEDYGKDIERAIRSTVREELAHQRLIGADDPVKVSTERLLQDFERVCNDLSSIMALA